MKIKFDDLTLLDKCLYLYQRMYPDQYIKVKEDINNIKYINTISFIIDMMDYLFSDERFIQILKISLTGSNNRFININNQENKFREDIDVI